MSTAIDLSIIIVNWNTLNLLKDCLNSIFQQTWDVSYDVWVVDNGSSDGSPDMVRREFPQVHLIENRTNMGFSRANNQAIRQSSGRYILLLNSDTEVIGDALRAFVRFMDDHPEAGAAGCQLLNPDGSLQFSCGRSLRLRSVLLGGVLANQIFKKLFPHRTFFAEYGLCEEDHGRSQEVDLVMGACLILRRDILEKTGLFDENIFLYFEEIDLCYRIRKAGLKIFYTPQASVRHYGGQSSKSSKDIVRNSLLSQEYFFKKHYGKAYATACRLLTFLGSALKIPFFAAFFLVPLNGYQKIARNKVLWHMGTLGFYSRQFFKRIYPK